MRFLLDRCVPLHPGAPPTSRGALAEVAATVRLDGRTVALEHIDHESTHTLPVQADAGNFRVDANYTLLVAAPAQIAGSIGCRP